MEIRKIKRSDEAAFRAFEAAMLEDKKINPFVEWWGIKDFDKYVSESDTSEVKKDGQSWSTYTRFFVFIEGEIAGLVICFWEIDHPDCQQLGHLGYMVAPKFRNQGLATALGKFGLSLYRDKGTPSIYICMAIDNQASRQTAMALGGVYLGEFEIEYQGKKLSSAKYEVVL